MIDLEPFLEKMSVLQRNVTINLVVKGMTYYDAYIDAGGKCKSNNKVSITARVQKIRTMTNFKEFERAYNQNKIEQAEAKAIATKDEALKLLSNLMRTSISDLVEFTVDEKGKQTNWKLRDDLTDDQIKTIKSVRTTKTGLAIDMHDKIQALDKIGKMLGWDSPTVIESNNNTMVTVLDGSEFKEIITDLLKNKL